MDTNIDDTKIVLFKDKKIRKLIYKNEWWFVIEDVVLALIDSNDPKQYIQRMKLRDPELAKGYVQFVHTLLIPTLGGKQKMVCANTEGIFRIIQSIPSPKAEPFKRWLAKVGYERVQEIENPELGMRRTRMLYKLKGYSEGWIENRMRGIAIRDELTDQWQKRGAKIQRDYQILTAEISKATFGVTPSEYKKIKGLSRENLRDNMDDLELIFSMLGERATTEIHKTENSQGMGKLRSDAKFGGKIAGDARKKLETRLHRPIVTTKKPLN